jgi:STE24 endopeptidase
MDGPTYRRAVEYTLAKNQLHRVELTWQAIAVVLILFTGFLPWLQGGIDRWLGPSVWAGGVFLCAVGLGLSLAGLPLEWYAQFRVETRFGFSTTTGKTWVIDHLKAGLLTLILGYPLVVLILEAAQWAGAHWWWLGWMIVVGFQLLMMIGAPALILPLFNKFTPLPDGSLKDRLLALAAQTGFRATRIQVMDGSRRSRHSNAFFTGLGRWRKIVLYDTLLEQLTEAELTSVLAHEIGHYRRRHLHKLTLLSAIGMLAGFYVVAALAADGGWARAFGLAETDLASTLVLTSLLAGSVLFWTLPLAHGWSRRFEYEADHFAAIAMKEVQSLIGALRKLTEKNLGNLRPHPLFAAVYYSHPTLAERESRLRAIKVD